MKPKGVLHMLFQLLAALAIGTVAIAPSLSQTDMRSLSVRGAKFFSASSGRSTLPPAQSSVFDSAQAEWVSYYSSGGLKGHAEGTAVTTDAQGNIYVAGKAENSSSSYDYLTVKYDAMGVELWSASYDGPAHGVDIANAVAVDAAGNVYVTGISAGIESGYDYATVKYNAAGQEQWVARYDGPGHGGDGASSIAVDGDGNAYVSGESAQSKSRWGYSENSDLATIKYNGLGIEQWAIRFDGRLHDDDKLVGLALDRSGNIVVVGETCDSVYFDSTAYTTELIGCMVIKYSSAGDQLWSVDYRPTDTISAYPEDFSVNESGDVIVTGYALNARGSWRGIQPMPAACMTVKFNSAGVLQWSSLYQNPHSQNAWGNHIASDHFGNTYVAGALVQLYNPYWSNDSLFILKYDSSGQLLWTTIVDRSPWSSLKMVGLASDPGGGVFLSSLASFNYASYPGAIITIKYSQTGDEQWRKRYDDPYQHRLTAPALTSDISGNVFIVGSSGGDQGTDMIMLMYAASGHREWSRTKECTRSWDQAYAVAVDDSNNVYVTGTSGTGAWASDILTIKYSSEGATRWITRYSGAFQSRNVPCALKVDHAGNVYVQATGDSMYSDGSPQNIQFVTVKYNASGQQQWAAAYHGQNAHAWFDAADMAIDYLGNVVVTGYSYNRQYVTVKYSPLGVLQWEARHDTTNTQGPTVVAIDDSNNIIVAGGTYIRKYDEMGNERWVRPALGYPYLPTGLAVDHSGNVYFTRTGATAKFNSSGGLLWSADLGGNALALDAGGNVLVRTQEGGIARFKSTGTLLWSLPFNDCLGSSLAIDSVGNAYIAGTRVFISNAEYQVRAFSPSGVQLWSTGFEDNGTSSCYQYPTAVSRRGDIFVGAGAQSGASSIYKTIKYHQVATSVKGDGDEIPSGFSLSQNYPNPFNPSTTIRFSVPAGTYGRVSLRVFDILGREVATLVNEQLSAGAYSTQWNALNVASGIYFFRLQAGGNTETKKLVIMK